MRDKLQLLIILMISLFYKSQDNSLASFVNTPAAYQTGIPNISYPLGSLPAAKDFTINFGLNYNPNGYEGGDYSGKVGRNWMFTGSNFMVTMDEHGKYYYSINNESGSFLFEMSGVFPNDIYTVKKLTPSNVKIESERIETTYSWNLRHIKSFKLTDSKGYVYVFEDFDWGKMPKSDGTGTYDERMVFHVTKIIDPANNEIAKYNYTSIVDRIKLLENVTTKYGRIVFEHSNSGESWDFHDRYFFKSFTLQDNNGKFISKFELELSNEAYSYYDPERFLTNEPQRIETRLLSRLKKLDKDSNIVEIVRFGYTRIPPKQPVWGSTVPAGTYKKGELLLNGLLNSVLPSSGSKIEYEFERNTEKIDPPIDYNTPSYISQIQSLSNVEIPPFSFISKTDSIHFDSKITRDYYLNNIQRSPQSKIFIKFNKEVIYPFEPGGPTNPSLGPNPQPKLVYVNRSTNGYSSGEIDLKYSAGRVVPNDGSIYLRIEGTGGSGWFEIYEKFWTEPPYDKKNEDFSDGVRIKSIKHYDRAPNFSQYYPHYNLKKTTDFDYSLFNEPGASSGMLVESMIYRNIKVTESDKPGYIRYYYKIPNDFSSHSVPSYPGYNFYPHWNYTKRGVLFKKEIYDINNVKKSLAEVDYTFPPYTNISSIVENVTPEKTIYTDTAFDSSGNSLTDTTERTFNQDNNNLMTEKRISADGIDSETIYQYAAEKGNSKLLDIGMLSVPLEVTQKQNGIQTGKLETKYDHAGNYFPSSVTSFGINNVITGEQTNDIYDNMGNVLQTRSKSGLATAIIWGYGRTQPIAKIEGEEYYNILALMGQTDANLLDIVQKSNLDVDSSNNTNEQLLRNALESFRQKPEFKKYLITTYTYDPLIGVKSVTSPNGMTEYYYYDNQNRMIRVEDTDHHVIKENKYLQNVYQY